MPLFAAELAVGDRLQADVLLHLHDVTNRLVLDLTSLCRDSPAAWSSRAQQPAGRKRLPDVIGTHGVCSSWPRLASLVDG
jgi:hypothetical protein